MQEKKCSNCGSSNLVCVTGISYKVRPGECHSGMTDVPFSSEDKSKETYICAECGHIEKFLKEDSQLMEIVRQLAKDSKH